MELPIRASTYISGLLGAMIVIGIALLILTLLVKIITTVLQIKTNRPSYITAICVLLFLAMLAYIRSVFLLDFTYSLVEKLIGSLIYPIPVLLSVFGLWKMKKWGLILLTSVMILIQIPILFAKMWNPMALLYFVPIVPAFFYFKRMK